jgi:hypothetical protein
MKPERVFPHSQQPATCPYPEPDRSSPCPPSHFSKIHFIIIFPSTPGSSEWSPSFRVSHWNHTCLYFPHTYYMPYPSQSFWLNCLIDIWWGIQSMKLLIMQSFPLPCYLVYLRPKYPPQHPFLKNPQPIFLPRCERPSFTPILNNWQGYEPSLNTFRKSVQPCKYLPVAWETISCYILLDKK